MQKNKVGIAIFASGKGSNALKIIEYPAISKTGMVKLIVSNKNDAGVLAIARQYRIPTLLIEKERFFRGDGYLPELEEAGIRLIVLAGFLWKVPPALIGAYRQRIINIHPALLPKYGGKGMYGENVHRAILNAGEQESGITIHYVDEHYDNGDIILQVKCPVFENDSPESLAERVHSLEHRHYPEVVARLANDLK